MKALLLGDVGGLLRDAAAELRVMADVAALQRRGWAVAVLGRGGNIDGLPLASVPSLSIAGDSGGRGYLSAVERFAAGDDKELPPTDPARRVLAQLESSDLLVVAGGDLSSARPWLLYERAATAALAQRAGTRIMLTGQQLGPSVLRHDEPILRSLLTRAERVTVADVRSQQVWRALGLPEHPPLVLDDVTTLVVGAPMRSGGPSAPVLAVLSPDTRHHSREDAIRAYATLLDSLATSHGVKVDLLPPARAMVGAEVDEAFAEHVAIAMSAPATVHRWTSANSVLAQVSKASAVVATQQTAGVAAFARGIPVIPVALGHPEEVAWSGVLASWGAGEPVLLDELVDGDLVTRVSTLPRRATTSVPDIEAAVQAEWDAVLIGPGHEMSTRAGRRRPSPPRHRVGPARVVIITRTKDRPVLLERALDDVLAQSFTRWHHVIVNDGGEPNAVQSLVAERADRYADRATIVHHDVAAGMEAASNVGLGAHDSELVVIHDDDDTWHPDFLARAVAHLDTHPAEEGVVARTEVVYERVTPHGILEEERHIHWPAIHEATLLDHLRTNRAVPISLLYRRRIHDLVGPYSEDLPVVGDWDFHLRILSRHDLGFLDGRPLAYWHKRRLVAGADANSVEAGWSSHRHHEVLLRDRHLRAFVAEFGLGLPLLIGRVDTTVADVDRRLERIESQLAELALSGQQRHLPLAKSLHRFKERLRRK